MGASAAPSEARREASDAGKVTSELICLYTSLLEDPPQDHQSDQKYSERHPKVDVLQNRRPPALRLFVFAAIWHQSVSIENLSVFLMGVGRQIGIP